MRESWRGVAQGGVGRLDDSRDDPQGRAVGAVASDGKRVAAFAEGCGDTLRRLGGGMRFIANLAAPAGLALKETRAASAFPSMVIFRDSSIRKKIIGHWLVVRAESFANDVRRREARGAVALFEQQARDRCTGLVRKPLIHQRGDFLSQIGGIREARELEALQRVFRSRQQKVPRRLVGAGAHGALLDHYVNGTCDNNAVKLCQEYGRITICGNLWKTLRPLPAFVRAHGSCGGSAAPISTPTYEVMTGFKACSACAGDYEDPERTAPPPEDASEFELDAEPEPQGGGREENHSTAPARTHLEGDASSWRARLTTEEFPAEKRVNAGEEASDAQDKTGK